VLAACTSTTSDTTSDSESQDSGPSDTGDSEHSGTPVDADNDGFTADVDCNDQNDQVYPGAPEICDGEDSNCDDETLFEGTVDGGLECDACQAAGIFPDFAIAPTWETLRGHIDPVSCDYGDAREFMFLELDKVDGQVEGVYTGVKVNVGSTIPDHTVMNTEHTWPQSLGAGSPPARCDVYHLYPTDSMANSARGSLSFREVDSADWSEGGSRRGTPVNGPEEKVFEPRAVHRGNVSRSMLYFALQYGYGISALDLDTYRRWHAADPIDQDEMDRAAGIQQEQGNVNAFIACPFAVDVADPPTSPIPQ